jgi:hypothetical protein
MLDEDRAAGFALPADTAWSTGIAFWIEAASRLGAVEAAPQLRAQIRPYHDQIATTHLTFEQAICHSLGRLDHLTSDYDHAERWFTEAIGIHERVHSPMLIARTQAAWAAMLADRNHNDDHTRAQTMAQAALTTATAGGYGDIETDARAVLDRLS